MLKSVAFASLSALANITASRPAQPYAIPDQQDDAEARPFENPNATIAFDRRGLMNRAPRLIIAARGRPRA